MSFLKLFQQLRKKLRNRKKKLEWAIIINKKIKAMRFTNIIYIGELFSYISIFISLIYLNSSLI